MEPVRVGTRGGVRTLPLRIVAAGVGAQVDIVLYVIGEGRWRPQNFQEVLFVDSNLVWNTATSSSNYGSLPHTLMAKHRGTPFLRQYAVRPSLVGRSPALPPLIV